MNESNEKLKWKTGDNPIIQSNKPISMAKYKIWNIKCEKWKLGIMLELAVEFLELIKRHLPHLSIFYTLTGMISNFMFNLGLRQRNSHNFLVLFFFGLMMSERGKETATVASIVWPVFWQSREREIHN